MIVKKAAKSLLFISQKAVKAGMLKNYLKKINNDEVKKVS